MGNKEERYKRWSNMLQTKENGTTYDGKDRTLYKSNYGTL